MTHTHVIRRASSAMRWIALLLLLAGFGVRVFQLGHDSFWNDEAEVALVAVEPDMGAAIASLPAHLVMPLDYLTMWLVAQAGVHELTFRFLSVVWATLSLPVLYQVGGRLSGRPTALVAVLLLVLSPLHVHYAQELRFYSSLIFFYCLATCLLLDAIEHPRPSKWVAASLAAVIGTCFHMHVPLSLVNAAAWLVLKKKDQATAARWGYFLVSGIVVSAAFFLEYAYFLAHQNFNSPLIVPGWNASLFEAIGQGFGWIALPYTPVPNATQAWGSLCMVAGLIGVASAFKRRPLSAGLAVSLVAQIGLIVVMDLVKGYWFVYRQVLLLLPWTLLFAAGGLASVGAGLARLGRAIPTSSAGSLAPAAVRWPTAILLILFSLSGLLALSEYYQWPKSTARQVSTLLIANWSPGDAILVMPAYQEQVYRFYLQFVLDRPDMLPAIQPVDRPPPEASPSGAFLIASLPLSDEERASLISLGFQPIVADSKRWGEHALFARGRP